MLLIDRYHNITLNAGDNAIFDFALCNEQLKTGDKVIFKCPEVTKEITEFTEGKAKIYIEASDINIKGCYYIKVEMQDGRKEVIINGNYIRLGGCQND